ncbi:MAG TPA: endonuclease/exonuclease/phosphatase family protein [Ktedonobacteraceae bacterium]|jgi:endonuclease/exonuclease/phosphatase family metal-dependent hydrolase|nr:endonuclease/exonuclease/phosphatase family protein [Ktedonobacteraceae bacterium]
MTRVLSYNILVGGRPRIDQITAMIQSADPDVVGLVEATNPRVVETLAKRLGMEYRMSASGRHSTDWQVAVLSRLPIVRMQVHIRPALLTKPLLEVCVEETDGNQLTVFVTHLTASFSHGRAGDSIRRTEVREILRIMAPLQGMPHLLMGDFNALAPGDRLKGSALLGYLAMLDQRYKQDALVNSGHPYLNFVVPPAFHIFNPILRAVPRSRILAPIFDELVTLYAPRGSIDLLLKAGYTDSFRYANPRASGFTCPAGAPAGRIDYIFASPEMARRLSGCKIITEGNGVQGEQASDHYPVLAEFGESVQHTLHDRGRKDVEELDVFQ